MACYHKKKQVLVARGYRWSAQFVPLDWKMYLISAKLWRKKKQIYFRKNSKASCTLDSQWRPHPLCISPTSGEETWTRAGHDCIPHLLFFWGIVLPHNPQGSFQYLTSPWQHHFIYFLKNISNKYFKCQVLITPLLPQIIMHYIIYWTSVHMLISFHSLHIVLDNPSDILLLSFDYCSFNCEALHMVDGGWLRVLFRTFYRRHLHSNKFSPIELGSLLTTLTFRFQFRPHLISKSMQYTF